MNDYEWETADGEVVLIREMDEKHIENVMRLIEKKGFRLYERIADDDFYDQIEHDLRPIYERMHIELRLRKMEMKGAKND